MLWLYCKRSLDIVSWDLLSTRWLTLWYIPSPFFLSFKLFTFGIFGRFSSALKKCSMTRRLLLFTAKLTFSFRAYHTRTLGKIKTIRQPVLWIGNEPTLISLFFQLPYSFLLNSVHAFSPHQNTRSSSFIIRYWDKKCIFGH